MAREHLRTELSGILAHMATQRIEVPAQRAFAYLCDPESLGRWSLGCFGTTPAGEAGLYTGRSLFDGRQGWFRIDPDARRLTVDYLVGAPEALSRRISARVIPGGEIAYPADTCLLTLTAWRPADMDDGRWARLCAAHEAELFLIKAQLETASPPTCDDGPPAHGNGG